MGGCLEAGPLGKNERKPFLRKADRDVPPLTATWQITLRASNRSLPLFMNSGVSNTGLWTGDLLLYTLTSKATRGSVQTTDPGRGRVTAPRKTLDASQSPPCADCRYYCCIFLTDAATTSLMW